MKKTTTITALTTLLLVAGCASVSTEYKTFEGVQSGIIEGKGGSKIIADGMEIWENGEPPHKFKILGFIDDSRETGLLSWSSDRDDIVEKAREAGGDAVIKLNSQAQLAEFYKAGGVVVNVYGGYAHTAYGASEKIVSKYAVIKYVK